MTFYDLPPDWHARALTDPTLAADVVDLVVRESDREGGCLALLMCDASGRMVQPVVLTEMQQCPPDQRRDTLDICLGGVADALGAVVVAVGRPRGCVPDDEARAWHEAVIAGCRAHEVTLLGTYLATPHAVVEMPLWPGLAATA